MLGLFCLITLDMRLAQGSETRGKAELNRISSEGVNIFPSGGKQNRKVPPTFVEGNPIGRLRVHG